MSNKGKDIETAEIDVEVVSSATKVASPASNPKPANPAVPVAVPVPDSKARENGGVVPGQDTPKAHPAVRAAMISLMAISFLLHLALHGVYRGVMTLGNYLIFKFHPDRSRYPGWYFVGYVLCGLSFIFFCIAYAFAIPFVHVDWYGRFLSVEHQKFYYKSLPFWMWVYYVRQVYVFDYENYYDIDLSMKYTYDFRFTIAHKNGKVQCGRDTEFDNAELIKAGEFGSDEERKDGKQKFVTDDRLKDYRATEDRLNDYRAEDNKNSAEGEEARQARLEASRAEEAK